MAKIPVYMMPGLAASSRIFENIILDKTQFDIIKLEWVLPIQNESLVAYAQRLINTQIKHENPVLIGVSFGGIIVQEMAKLISVNKVIIVSSVTTANDFPRRMKWAKRTGLYKILPTSLAKHFQIISKFVFSRRIKKRIQLYRKYLSVNDVSYLDWALEKTIHWDRTIADKSVIHIHGTQDSVFPIKYLTTPYIPVKGGTHIMILNRYHWFNENLPALILE